MEKDKYNMFRLVRLWRNKTVQQIADELNVSTSTISALENGTRNPTREVRAKYARAFPVDQSYFEFIDAYEKMV